MWSTLLTCTCRAGVTHSWQEHILPDQITSPIRTPHFGQFSFRSLSSLSGSQAGGSMNSELHPLPCNTFANRPVRHFWQRQQSVTFGGFSAGAGAPLYCGEGPIFWGCWWGVSPLFSLLSITDISSTYPILSSRRRLAPSPEFAYNNIPIELMKFPPCTPPPHASHSTHPIHKPSASLRPPPRKSPHSLPDSLPSTPSKATALPSGHYDFQVGEQMGDYRAVGLLGEGTFGRVVLAEKAGRRYAIKVIRPVPRYVESAKVEREILKALRSRDRKDEAGLVHYLHSFYHREHFCLVFRPLGLSIYELIKKNSFRGFPLKLVQSFLRQLLTSLAFIHKLGYTHTDLKPENILLEKSELRLDSSRDYQYWLPVANRIRLIDFGGATLFSESHSPLICTRQYRPPEVILGCEQWNQMADIWSVACIAVELLTGDLLFPTHSDEQHLRMMLKNSGPFPHWMQAKTQNAELRQLLQPAQPELPGVAETKTAHELIPHPALRDLVRHCLHLDPTRRLNAAAALRHPFFKEKLT